MVGFNQRVNLVACYLLILSILLHNKLEMFHEDTQHHAKNLIERTISFWDIAHSRYKHFCIFLSASVVSRSQTISPRLLE